MASAEGVPPKIQNMDTFFKLTAAGFLRQKGYRLGKTIGEGSYCKVKSALKVFADGQAKRMACKIISKRKASEEFVTKFLPRELSIIQHIRHPNIIQVFDIFESTDHVYIFMNHCDKGDLLEYVRKRGVLRDQKSKLFFRWAATALWFSILVLILTPCLYLCFRSNRSANFDKCHFLVYKTIYRINLFLKIHSF